MRAASAASAGPSGSSNSCCFFSHPPPDNRRGRAEHRECHLAVTAQCRARALRHCTAAGDSALEPGGRGSALDFNKRRYIRPHTRARKYPPCGRMSTLSTGMSTVSRPQPPANIRYTSTPPPCPWPPVGQPVVTFYNSQMHPSPPTHLPVASSSSASSMRPSPSSGAWAVISSAAARGRAPPARPPLSPASASRYSSTVGSQRA